MVWRSVGSSGNAFVDLDNKLRATAKALQRWSDRWIGNIRLQIAIALEVIAQLDKAMDLRVLTEREHGLRKTLKRKLLGLCSLQRSIARQRSRLLQLKEGEANTSFFHRQASHRQRKNIILSIHSEGQVFTGQNNIAQAIDDYYQRLLGSAAERSHTLNLQLLGLPRRDLRKLEDPFSVDEVEKVIKEMPMDKAPGPDGFTGRFYATCWHIIKNDFMKAIDMFHGGDMRGLQAINRATVSLLPKKVGAVDIKDFRPVSLNHGAVKIFDKVLATRLTEDLPNLVGNHQSAFVRGRSLHDNFMLVQGTTRRLHALRDPTVLVKLDISKAFDSLQWPFLLEVLGQMGFGPRWISWICGLLATSSTKIAVNGIPGETIYNCQGLRQGSPLSPMIFILCMEPLHRLFEYATAAGLLTPLARTGLRQRVSMYADDAMIFLKPKELDLQACAAILNMFGHASGLKINLQKSSALPIRCTQEHMQLVSELLGCVSTSFPCRYLGLPLSIRKQTALQFQDLVDQIAARLPTWKAASLPKSSRLLLVQSVLCAIPVHSMIAMGLPPKTIKAIIKICRNFLWSGKEEAAGGKCAVAWETLCRPKWAGGLGVPNLRWMNVALQAKWLWLQRTDKSRPWAEFAFSITEEARGLFQAATRLILGDGQTALFWEDRWLDGYRIQELAPVVYAKVPKKVRMSRTVADALLDATWARDFGANLDETGLRQFLETWSRVATITLNTQLPDQLRWSWEKDGQFSARSAYAAGFATMHVSPTAVFTWISNAPLRCRFFAWLALRNRVWTSDRLAKRGLPHQNACPLCDQGDEDINHLLLHCVFTREIWTKLGQAMGITGMTPTVGEDLKAWCTRAIPQGKHGKSYRAIHLLTMWVLWKHRNSVVFDGARPDVQLVMRKIASECVLWRQAGILQADLPISFLAVDGWVVDE